MSLATAPAPAAPPPYRHALGLPAGSIRAMLALGVLVLLWGLTLLYQHKAQPLPIEFVYLQILMVLILAHYFAAHGKSIGGAVDTRAPLGLPRGSVRFLLLAGYLGLTYFLYRNQSQFEMPEHILLLQHMAILITGFFLGHLIAGGFRTINNGRPGMWIVVAGCETND